MVHDKAYPIRTGSKDFAAFVTQFKDCAVVQIYRKVLQPYAVSEHEFTIDFRRPVSEYETGKRNASDSARKEVRKLERARRN